MNQLIFSTGNEAKFSTASQVCAQYGIELIQSHSDIDEIQNEDAQLIVLDKGRKAFALAGQPVIVSDDSWVMPGLNGFPGPYMKSMNEWFTAEDFIRLTAHLSDKRAYLVQYLAFHDVNQEKVFTQKQEGIVLDEPRGSYGPASYKVISMVGDNDLSISEVHSRDATLTDRSAGIVWHEFAAWYQQQLSA
jgi:XTP/dITP diphosphohydrolase